MGWGASQTFEKVTRIFLKIFSSLKIDYYIIKSEKHNVYESILCMLKYLTKILQLINYRNNAKPIFKLNWHNGFF